MNRPPNTTHKALSETLSTQLALLILLRWVVKDGCVCGLCLTQKVEKISIVLYLFDWFGLSPSNVAQANVGWT